MLLITLSFGRPMMPSRPRPNLLRPQRPPMSDLLLAAALGVALAAFCYWQIRRGLRRRKRG